MTRLFAEWGQLRQVMSVVVPTAIYVGAMPFTGLYLASIIFIGWFMRWLGKYSWLVVLAVALRHAHRHLFHFRALVSGPASQGADRGMARSVDVVISTGCRTYRDGRTRQSVSRLRGRAAALQHHGDDRRHRARRHHRRAAGTGRRQRRGDPAAADVQHAADIGHHHAVLHLLGRAVRRRDHLDPVQHTRRTMVGRDDVRRLPDGAAGQGRRGADGGASPRRSSARCSPSS